MKELIKITSLSVTTGATVAQATLETQDFVLSESIALFTESGLPVIVSEVRKVSGANYELELKKSWPYADQVEAEGVLLPTTIDLREVTRQVSQQNEAFTGWFTKMDTWLNEMGTVEVQGPSGATLIKTLPELTYYVEQNADQVQADIALIGDAPSYAQNAKDEADRATAKAVEAANSATAAKNSEQAAATSEGNSADSATLSSSKAADASESASKAKVSETKSADSEQSALAHKNKAQKWSQEVYGAQVEAGKYSAYHWSIDSKNSAEAASTSETNAKSSETKSLASEEAAKQSETQADQHRIAASEWAAKGVDVEVTAGKYSSYHYSVKAKASEQAAAASEQVATEKASQASNDASMAELHKQNAGSHSVDASNSKNLAKKWAEEAYGVEVIAGEYSAYHWSVDSKNSAAAAKQSENASALSQQVASDKADQASNSENIAKQKAQQASSSAEAASTSEDNSKQNELKSKAWAENDVDLEVETGFYSSKHHAVKASDSSSAAANYEQQAAKHKSDTSGMMTQTESYMNKAYKWAEENDDVEVEPGQYSGKHWAGVSKGYSDEAKSAAQALTGGMYFGGKWDASTGQAPPTPDSGSAFYKIQTSGTIDGEEYAIGDSIIYNSIDQVWFKLDGSDKVDSVNGKIGAVTLTHEDVAALPDTWTPTWSQVRNKPATATRWPLWSEVTSKPSTFTPASHSHDLSDVSFANQNLNTNSDVAFKSLTLTGYGNTHFNQGPNHDIYLTYGATGNLYARTYDGTDHGERWKIYHEGYKPSWSDVTDKPTKFAPSAHNHDASEIISGVLEPARVPDIGKATGLRFVINDYVRDAQGHSRLYFGSTTASYAAIFRASATGQRWEFRNSENSSVFRIDDSGEIIQGAITWGRVLNKPSTATRWPTTSEIGAVKESHGKIVNGHFCNYIHLDDYDDGVGGESGLKTYIRDGVWNINKDTNTPGSPQIQLAGNLVYHEGHKPTLSELGAASAAHNHDDRYVSSDADSSKVGFLHLNHQTGKTLSSLNATNDSSNRWNTPHNYGLGVRNGNNLLSIAVGGATNDRRANIQVGHVSSGYASALGTLYLNKLGGSVATGANLDVGGDLQIEGRLNSPGGANSSYGSLTISGYRGSYSGIHFDSGNLTFMTKVDGSRSGLYDPGKSTWIWGFDNGGALTYGHVPWSKISSIDSSASKSVTFRGSVNFPSPDEYGDGIHVVRASGSNTSGWPISYGIGILVNGNDYNFALYYDRLNASRLEYKGHSGSGNWATYRIYHTGYKPNANDVGLGILESHNDGIKIYRSGGYVTIGNRNSSYTHYSSSTGQHYFYGAIVAQGNITAYSDMSLKKNVERIQKPLSKVMAINGYTYDRNDIKTKRQTGVSAQEVLKVLPEAVSGGPTGKDPDGKYSVAYGNMVGLLVEAIKEQQQQINNLERRITH